MVVNNIPRDISEICRSEGITKAELGRRIGVLRQTERTIETSQLINKRFIEMLEAAGYDIEITYIRRKG